jgi:hypothetical protein
MAALYLGNYSASIQGERANLPIPRMFSAAYQPSGWGYGAGVLPGPSMLDSGAFSDRPDARLSPAKALDRQLYWEQLASEKWGCNWQAHAFVSYDLLIDETWVAGAKHKRRWTVKQAEWAVAETVAAAAYLDSQRERIAPPPPRHCGAGS